MTTDFDGMEHSGGCHCGNIHVRLRLSKRPQDTPLRACACSFCRSHNTRTVADPDGLFELGADDWSLVESCRFGTRTADFILCRRCGVYIAAVCETAAGTCAVVNVNCLNDRGAFASVPRVRNMTVRVPGWAEAALAPPVAGLCPPATRAWPDR